MKLNRVEQIRELMQAFKRYNEAKTAHDLAYVNFDGYSWDYYGHDVIEGLKEAEGHLVETLDAYVEQTVIRVLKKRKKK